MNLAPKATGGSFEALANHFDLLLEVSTKIFELLVRLVGFRSQPAAPPFRGKCTKYTNRGQLGQMAHRRHRLHRIILGGYLGAFVL